ncbi:MAG: class I SAM-dependent RNA methyltransferase, partial [Pyrinomonadaceae bacterium]
MRRRQTRKPRPAESQNEQTAPVEIEVVIERIIPGGFGLGHWEGQTVMVPLTVPGDKAWARVERKSGKVLFARLLNVSESGPDRVLPGCEYFGICGGCDFQQLNYASQLRAKSAIIQDCFRRIAGVSLEDVTVVPSPDPWAYRSRAEWQCHPDPPVVGYFERGSHKICDVAVCPILTSGVQKALIAARARVSDADGRIRAGEIQATEGDDGVAVTPPVIGGPGRLVHRRIGEFLYEYGAESFFQANAGLLPALVDLVTADAIGRLAVDLYCGVGLFSLPLARRFEQLHGVEGDEGAIAFADHNATEAGLTNTTFINGSVDQWLDEEAPQLGTIDLLVLDPPRTGAGSQTIDAITAAAPNRIVYVSCDPATLARDTKQLLKSGYGLTSVTGFDLFP